ncbi:MAG: hypothetical protein IIA14_16380 [SAR324 cluster bacterium]|nr:hypothetical protein [SAR324 cluster bacterium]
MEIEPASGGTALQSTLFLTAVSGTTNTDTGSLTGSINVSAFVGQTVQIAFEWFVPENFTGPADFQLDNIRVQ